MSQESRQALLLVLGGLATAGGVATLALWPRPKALPSSGWQTFSGAYTEADVEAGARMLASENPRGSKQLHIEQVFTQLRARKPGQSLFDRITAGSGWGRQGERQGSGGVRPVSTDQPANDSQRQLVREILEGTYASQFLGARQFFEPGQQDKALAIGFVGAASLLGSARASSSTAKSVCDCRRSRWRAVWGRAKAKRQIGRLTKRLASGLIVRISQYGPARGGPTSSPCLVMKRR